ncbi:hypothetical protein ACFFHM_13770 [Halalkalibacter kiskunsagensis]|uniref:Metalloprotease n=1 Tax=Halalkalibacter kiskunsagensis TaxID=1548599 RepID=A0ABV6KE06_9BACI
MKIIKALDFIYEREEFLQQQFKISRTCAQQGLEGIDETIKWLKTSIFQTIVDDLTFYISDEPINFPGELAIDEGKTFQPVIYINIMSVTEDFQNKEYLYDMKRDHTTCFEYASFVVFHEVGHYVQALMGGRGENKKDRLYDYFDKGEYYYERFIANMKHGVTLEEKKKYRMIPHEKAADNFARQHLQIMMDSYK